MRNIEAFQYCKENIEKLEELISLLKDLVMSKDEGQIFFVKSSGLGVLVRFMNIPISIYFL